MPKHSHSFSGTTTYDQGHIHHYGGVTSIEEGGVPHVHEIEDFTTYNRGHQHPYTTRTGPAIYLPNGLHYHVIQTRVKLVNNHIHYIRDYTSTD
ncbi:MAG: YmaF family protein [Clostridiaceae bacterium]